MAIKGQNLKMLLTSKRNAIIFAFYNILHSSEALMWCTLTCVAGTGIFAGTNPHMELTDGHELGEYL